MRNGWPFVGRTGEFARARDAARHGTGILATGESGVGKSAFVRELAARLADGTPGPVVVLGHEVSRATPYAAFSSVVDLVGDHERPVLPAEIAARLAAVLVPNQRGWRVLVVDDLSLVDEHSAAVILELAVRHQVIVLCTSQVLPSSGSAARLWREGCVHVVELGGLTTEEVAEFLEGGLHGPVDVHTVLAFARRCQGNPLVLRELVTAALAADALVARNGWRLVDEAPIGSATRDLIGRRLDAVTGPERSALELVAATEPVLLATALDLVGEESLEALERDHLIAVTAGPGGTQVTTAHPLFGEMLRAALPFVRMRHYRLDVAQRTEAAARPRPVDLVRGALWRLDDGQPQEPERLLHAARQARGMSLEVAERLARHAVDNGGGVAATVLLAEVLVHSGRGDEAAGLAGGLPPASLRAADREALAYCAAIAEGLAVGDSAHGVELVQGVLAGDDRASVGLRALQASLLAFDARPEEALAVGRPIVDDVAVAVAPRALAAVGVVGAEYWLGHLDRAVVDCEELAPVLRAAAEAVPYAESSVVLMAVCALLERGDHDQALRRAEALRRRAVADDDSLALPRSEYLLARIDLYRGRGRAAIRRLRRCTASLSAFDQFASRHIQGVLARAEAEMGNRAPAQAALDAGSVGTVLKPYEPEWELARAAVLAARLDLEQAADLAAWAATVAVEQRQPGSALLAYHDAARYGSARAVLRAVRRLPGVDGPLADVLVAHVVALAADDPVALDDVASAFLELGALVWSREAAAAAGRAHARTGDPRAARASAQRASRLGVRLETPLAPWLVDLGELGRPLTARERQVALLAAGGRSDKAIAAELGISPRTVSTQLSRCYAKLGISGRDRLVAVLDPMSP